MARVSIQTFYFPRANMHHPFHVQAECGTKPKSPTKTRPPCNSQAPALVAGPSPRPTTQPTSPPNSSRPPTLLAAAWPESQPTKPRSLPPCGGTPAERAAGQIFRNYRQPMVALRDVPIRCALLTKTPARPHSRAPPANQPSRRPLDWLVG